ncbi:hypothetical protein MHUMG1_05872 [Metarhizium humberi]|uniref:Protein kinase domain-containing protein n=1 Tax=Metarhizium humberi TaxID=2596975 RepID=A0A9P8S761_9HYPO|nr:hypothetical protein MHUMG1_05872 [Metarhizium humberi]
MSQEPSHSNVGFAQREHDILSLLSIFVHTHQTLSIGFRLLGIVLDDQSFYMPAPVKEGGYFEVYILRSKDILEADLLGSKEDIPSNLPRTVAVKCPKVRGKLNDRRNQKLWTSMAMELQILKHEHVKNHDNIIKLLGLSWRSVRGTYMPAFILEAAKSDLYSMIQSFQFTLDKMTTRKILGLAVDISCGLSALHDLGIIHGDMKPQNVLIFEDQKLGFVAKITDFGSSLLKTDIKEPIVLPYNTDIWQAPECQNALDGSQLIEADNFSLGLVLCYMLSRGLILHQLEESDEKPATDGQSAVSYDFYAKVATEALHATFRPALEIEEERLYGLMSSRKPEGWPDPNEKVDNLDEDESYVSIRKIQRAVARTLLPSLFEPPMRPSSKSIYLNMRVCFSWLLRRDTFYPILSLHDPFTPERLKAANFNDQERDVLQNPGAIATKEDKERVWKYATTMEWLDRSIKTIQQGGDLPSMDDISQSDAAHRIATSLKTWTQSEAPPRNNMREVRNPFAVVEAEASFGTMRCIPACVLNQILGEMRAVACNERESESRRAEAAWQCSIFQIMAAQLDQADNPDISPTLELMLLAANLGNWKAQSICGWLHSVFDRPFPVSEAVELEWLHDSICKGSATARRRLESLDPGAYAIAVDDLKRCWAGIGVNLPDDWQIYDDIDFLGLLEDQPRLVGDYLQIAATCGRLSLLRTILNKYTSIIDINARYPGDETILLKACRSGHFEVVLCLLDQDADASICSEDGAAPLHFLSAFEEEQIPLIANRLVAAKASLKARSKNAKLYKLAVDATFGMVDGTPLTWAVAANNHAATQALLDLGSDPFDIAGRTAEYGDSWSNNAHISPVWTAAASFQYELLEMLLKRAGDCAEHLNYNERTFGTQGLKDPFTILGWVVNGCEGHGIRRLLLHGKQFSQAFQRTFDLLLQYGADPSNVSVEGLSFIRTAIQRGQPYIIDHLMTTRGGMFKPTASDWSHCVLIALALQDNSTLGVLLRHSQAEALDPDHWNKFFASTKALPDDSEMLDHFRKYRDSNLDMLPHCGNALLAGKYKLAKWLYQTGECDLTTMENDKTLLGRLITASKVYRNASLHIAAFLSLNPPDEVYYNVIDLLGSRLTALQAVVYIQEYRHGQMATTDILQAILRKKTDTDYLNLRVEGGPWQGKTALHLAVESCNVDAVQYLIDAKGRHLDLSALDGNGFSLIDHAALLMKNQKSNMDVWEVPSEKRRDVDLRHFENTLLIMRLLYRTKRAKPNKLALSLTRVEVDELQVILYGDEEQLVIPCKIPDLKRAIESGQYNCDDWPESSNPLRRQSVMIFQVLRDYGLKLGVNDSVFGYTDTVKPAAGHDSGGEQSLVSDPGEQRDGQEAYSEFVNSVKKLKL